MDSKPLKPEIIVSSFDAEDVHKYIDHLNEIRQVFGPNQAIILHIDSYGGECFGLIMLLEHLAAIDNPIITYTTSKAMSSGAFLLAIAGTPGYRFASPHATILIHEIQGGACGDMKEMEQQLGSISALNDKILTLFAKATGLKSAIEVRELIKARSVGHDLALTASEAKEMKIIDEVAYLRLEPTMGFNLEICPAKIKAARTKKKPKPKKN